MNSQKGKSPSMKRSYSECKPEEMKLVSVSPYRAVVKIDRNVQSQHNSHNSNNREAIDDDTDDDEEEDIQR